MENNLIGKTYGYLTVIAKTDKTKERSVVWECRCKCGNVCYVSTRSLNAGETQSCGCKKIELNKKQISVARNNVIIAENTNASRISTNKKPKNNGAKQMENKITEKKYSGYGYHGGGRKAGTAEKTANLSIRCRPKELDAIKRNAESAGMTVSEYIVSKSI